jgi:hypothetical protein
MVAWSCFYSLFQRVNYTTFFFQCVTAPCLSDTIFKKINLMLPENIQILSLCDLVDLLVSTHARMHDLMRQKETETAVIRDMRRDVRLIQSVILKKKSVNSVLPAMKAVA